MPFETFDTIDDRLRQLNAEYTHRAAIPVMRKALSDPIVGTTALVSSFGAESVVLLHMISLIDRTTPVLFIDTEMLFDETLSYQQELADSLGLTNITTIKASSAAVSSADPKGTLHKTNPDACCSLRKTEPLNAALARFDAWITGRKRFQAGSRKELALFEADGNARIKINPLAFWRREDIQEYIINNNLPRHPLVAQGYPSIGCSPCTSTVADGEDERAGRWRGQEKIECGIHFENGKMVRG